MKRLIFIFAILATVAWATEKQVGPIIPRRVYEAELSDTVFDSGELVWVEDDTLGRHLAIGDGVSAGGINLWSPVNSTGYFVDGTVEDFEYAVENAVAGRPIYLPAGTYALTGDMLHDTEADIIVLGAAGGARAVLTGAKFTVGADCTIEGLDVTGATPAYFDFTFTDNATKNITLRHCDAGNYPSDTYFPSKTVNVNLDYTTIGIAWVCDSQGFGAPTNNGYINNSVLGGQALQRAVNTANITNSTFGSSFHQSGTNNGTISNSTFVQTAATLTATAGTGDFINCTDTNGVLFSTADAVFDGSVTAGSVATVGGADLDEIDTYFANAMSAGRLWGGEITDNHDGTVTIAAGAGLVKNDASDLESIPTAVNQGQASDYTLVSWDEDATFALTGDGYNLIYWDASLGELTSSLDSTFYADFDFTRDFTIGRVFKDGTDILARLCGMNLWNFPRRVQMFGEERFPVERVLGLVIGATGLQYSITDGVIWAEMVNRFPVDGKALADNFTYYYYDGAAWQIVTTNTIDNANYNDATSGLTAMIPNRWRADYVYADHESNHYVVYGQAQYTSQALAQAAPIPTPPAKLGAYATVVGRITVKTSATEMTADSPFADTFAASVVPSHNSLSGLQGGATDAYYHGTEELGSAAYEDSTAFYDITGDTLEGDLDAGGYEIKGAAAMEFVSSHSTTNYVTRVIWNAEDQVFETTTIGTPQ